MGDVIETTVTVFEPFLFYKANGNGMWFEIKTGGKALVGLSKVAIDSCQYWIDFNSPGQISIYGGSQVKTKAGLPFTLSGDKFSRFWVAWDAKFVWAGIGHNLDIVISSPIASKLNFITFSTKDPAHPSTFRFEVPPLRLSKPPVHKVPEITAGKLQWKSCDDQLPDEAVVGGHIDGEIVYIVRSHHRRSLTPGVFVPSKGLAYIPWGGSDNPTSEFEALCGFNLKWKSAFEHKIPIDAFIAGYSEENREPLYVGRASYGQNIIPGKVQISHRVCYVTYQAREIAVKNFEVLTEPGLNAYCENEYVGTKPPCRNPLLEEDYDDDEYDDDHHVMHL